MEPNTLPPIIPTTTPGVPSSPREDVSGALLASLATQYAKASVDAQKQFESWIGIMRKGKYSFEEIAKFAETEQKNGMALLNIRKSEASVMRQFAPEMNMTIEQMRKMPLKDLGKNLGGIAGSFANLLNPVMAVGTAVTAMAAVFKGAFDSISHLNAGAAGFAVSRGDISGAINSSYKDRKAVNLANAAMGVMGYSREEQGAIRGTLNRAVPLTAQQGLGATMAAASIAKLTGEDPTVVAKREAEALKSGVHLSEFDRVLQHTINHAKEFGTSSSEAAKRTDDLFMANRALGVSYTDASKIAGRFSNELNKGIITIGELANLDPRKRQVQDNFRMIAVARMAGLKIPGVTDEADMMKANARLTPKMLEKIGLEAPNLFAKRVGGGDAEREQTFRQMLAQGAASTGVAGITMAATAGGKIPAAEGISTDDAKQIASFASQAASLEGAVASWSKTIGDATRGLGDLTDSFVNAASRFAGAGGAGPSGYGQDSGMRPRED